MTTSVRYDTDTMAGSVCEQCGAGFTPVGRRRWCSDACRQSAWRRRRAAPRPAQPAKIDTVYECPQCQARYLGVQRCEDCNTWCRRLGAGGPCPHCATLLPSQISSPTTSTAPHPQRSDRRTARGANPTNTPAPPGLTASQPGTFTIDNGPRTETWKRGSPLRPPERPGQAIAFTRVKAAQSHADVRSTHPPPPGSASVPRKRDIPQGAISSNDPSPATRRSWSPDP